MPESAQIAGAKPVVAAQLLGPSLHGLTDQRVAMLLHGRKQA
jgi:hypothetical protein